MAIVMRRYYTAHIAWWRRFVAFIKATKRHHWASTRSNSFQPDMQMPVDSFISSWKKTPVDMLAPNKNRSVTYQTDGNHISKTIGYLVGVVELAWYSLNTRLLLRVFTNNHLIYFLNWISKKLLTCYVYKFFDPPRLAPYHCPPVVIFFSSASSQSITSSGHCSQQPAHPFHH